MKKTILTFSTAALLIMGGVITGCNSSSDGSKKHDDHEHHTEAASYQCPMKCEGEKTYDKAGSCPVCGMDLKKVESHHEHSESEEHAH